MKTIKTIRLTSRPLTRHKYAQVARAISCFQESVNFLIAKCVENPLFQKASKKGNIYYDYSSYPKIRKSFYHEWKAKFPNFHTH